MSVGGSVGVGVGLWVGGWVCGSVGVGVRTDNPYLYAMHTMSNS